MVDNDQENDFQCIHRLLEDYCDGLHQADTAKLDQIFHDDVVLKAPGVRRNKREWLRLVETRPIPAEAGYPFDYQVLSLQVYGEQAMAMVACPLLGKNYLDFLGFLKEDGCWKIVNKMYAESKVF